MSSERKQSFHRGDAKGAEKNLFVWRTEGSGLFSEEIPLNKKIPVVLIPDPFYLPWPLRRLDLNPKGKKLLIQSPFPDWIRIKSSLCDLCASTMKRNTTEQDDSERKTILELLQAKSSCGMGFNLPIRQCEAPPFKAGGQALLRVNLEQAPAFRPGSRKVHILYFPKSSGFMSEIRDFSSSSSSKRPDAKTPICFVDEITDSAT